MSDAAVLAAVLAILRVVIDRLDAIPEDRGGLLGIPVARILRRVGMNRWWSVLSVIPLANLIGLWVFAFMRWPTDAPEPDRRAA